MPCNQCAYLVGASWMEGRGRKVFRVVYFGECHDIQLWKVVGDNTLSCLSLQIYVLAGVPTYQTKAFRVFFNDIPVA